MRLDSSRAASDEAASEACPGQEFGERLEDGGWTDHVLIKQGQSNQMRLRRLIDELTEWKRKVPEEATSALKAADLRLKRVEEDMKRTQQDVDGAMDRLEKAEIAEPQLG